MIKIKKTLERDAEQEVAMKLSRHGMNPLK